MEKAKTAFMSNDSKEIGQLNSYLRKKHKIETELDSYIGYPTLKVAEKDYYKALMFGSMYLINKQFNSVCWVSPSNTRMHNIDDLAIESRACYKLNLDLPKRVVEKLEEQQYSTGQEYDPEEFSI